MVTVTNTGQADAAGMSATLFRVSGSGGTVVVNGPYPLMPAIIPGGASRVFTWTFTGSVNGETAFSASATGTDINSGSIVLSCPALASTIYITGPGTLDSMVIAPSSASLGQWLEVGLTVTNTGDANILGVAGNLSIAPGVGTIVGGPVPAGPVTITPGGIQVITWTYSVSGIGPHVFTATVTGVTCGSTPLQSVSTSALNAVMPATLNGALSISATILVIGQNMQVVLTVTNAGGATATGVSPSINVSSGSGLGLLVPSGPVDIAPSGTQLFIWTYTATSAGAFLFTASATGKDGNSNITVFAGPSDSTVPATVFAPGALVIDGFSLQPQPGVRMSWTVTGRIVVKNSGGIGISVTAMSISEIPSGLLAAPVSFDPLLPEMIPGGGSRLFTWSYFPPHAGCGFVSASATVCGIEQQTMEARRAYGVSAVLGIAGNPVGLIAASSSAQAETGKSVIISAAVVDGCGVPVPDSPVKAEILAGSGVISPAQAATGTNGRITLTLTVGNTPGRNAVLLSIQEGNWATSTVYVDGVGRAHDKPIMAYPNPIRADRLNVSLDFNGDARQLTVDIFNVAMRRIYAGTWNISGNDSEVSIDGLSAWAPGVYLLRARAIMQDNSKKDFPVIKVVVKRP